MPARKFILFFLCFCFSIRSIAQTGVSITGQVTDQNNQPIEFANVLLIKSADSSQVKAVVTDKKGKFTIIGVAPATYVLRCSYIGSQPELSQPFTITDGQRMYRAETIVLAAVTKQLDNVTVSGKKSTLNTAIDRKVYNVDQDIMSKSGSVSDILKNIPSVEVDIEGQVSLRGSADVMILINGKPSPLMGKTRAEVLQQLPANSIERIEVITNPSARYRPDGTSGIINIVLKKNIKKGWNGTAIANAGNRDRYNGNLTLNYNPGKFNAFINYSIRQDNRNRFNTLDRTNFDSTGKIRDYYNLSGVSLARPVSHIITGGIDYNMNDHNSFGVSGSYYDREQLKHDVVNYTTYNISHNLLSAYDRLRTDPESEIEKNGTAYFEHKFAKEDHELRAEFNISKSDEVEDNHYSNVYSFPGKQLTYDNTLIKQASNDKQLTIDYTNPLSEDSKLEAGYDGKFNHADMDFFGEYFDTTQKKFVKDFTKSNRFVYNENVNAVYATYQRSLGALGFSLGLRAEDASISGHLVTIDSFITNHYFKVYPTIHLSYKVSDKSELQLNYSKRVHRPEGDDINPFPEYQDPRNLRAGNPKLLPEIIHSFEFGYKWQNKNFSFVPSIYFRNKQNAFTNVIIKLNDSTFLSTSQNLATDQSAGLELIFSAKAGKFMSANLSTNIFYNKIDASNLGYSTAKSIMSMSTNLSTNFNFTKTTMGQVSVNYRSARLTPQGKQYGSFVANMGIRQDIMNGKVSFVFTASDIFKTLIQKSEINTPYLQQVSESRRDGRILYLGVSYRFGATKKPKEEKLQFDNNL